ncbi:hypothetical protein ACUXV3_10585 [Roseobacteraceae bacterium NS-SX3]
MLTDIYARSLLTAARQDCVPLRPLPPVRPRPARPLARLRHWLFTPRGKRICLDPKKI